MERVAGGLMTRYPSVFSRDASTLFVPSGHTVKVVSVRTAAVLSLLDGHTADVTCVLLPPNDDDHVVTASRDATVCLWRWSTGQAVTTWSVHRPIFHAAWDPSSSGTVLILAVRKTMPPPITAASPSDAASSSAADPSSGKQARTDGDKRKGKRRRDASAEAAREVHRVVRLEISPNAGKRSSVNLFKAWRTRGIAVSEDGQVIVAVALRTLYVYRTATAKLKRYSHAHPLTCVAIAPGAVADQPLIATGDATGRIVLWRCLGDDLDPKHVVTSTLHWHAHAVAALAFAGEGAYLLSGGEEKVLVIWQLDTGHRQFLPRLGGAITALSVAPTQLLYAVSMTGNAIKIIHASDLQVKQQLRGWTGLGSPDAPLLTGLVIDPRSNNIVVNGPDGTVAMYDVERDAQVGEVVVVPRNPVSRMQQQRVPSSRVERVAFARRGGWMATVDRRADGVSMDLICLKVWQHVAGTGGGSWALNTRVDMPHKQPVTGLAFHPTQPLLVTASMDGKFKTWVMKSLHDNGASSSTAGTGNDGAAHVPTEAPVIPHEVTAWVLRSVGFFRDYPARTLDFSHDGSILAIAYGQVVTLWRATDNTLLATLTAPPPSQAVLRVAFLGTSRYLLAVSAKAVYVWDLAAAAVHWALQLTVRYVAVHPTSGTFAVAVAAPLNRMFVLEFAAESPTPARVHSLGAMPSRAVSGLVFVDDKLVISTGRSEILLLGDGTAAPASTRAPTHATADAAAGAPAPSAFANLFAPASTKTDAAAAAAVPLPATATKAEDVLAAPSHALPPVLSVFSSVMDTMLARSDGVGVARGSVGDDVVTALPGDVDDSLAEYFQRPGVVGDEDDEVDSDFAGDNGVAKHQGNGNGVAVEDSSDEDEDDDDDDSGDDAAGRTQPKRKRARLSSVSAPGRTTGSSNKAGTTDVLADRATTFSYELPAAYANVLGNGTITTTSAAATATPVRSAKRSKSSSKVAADAISTPANTPSSKKKNGKNGTSVTAPMTTGKIRSGATASSAKKQKKQASPSPLHTRSGRRRRTQA